MATRKKPPSMLGEQYETVREETGMNRAKMDEESIGGHIVGGLAQGGLSGPIGRRKPAAISPSTRRLIEDDNPIGKRRR